MISIITVNYNNFDGLKKTVQSVIQFKKNNPLVIMEYLIIDGGSDDGSKDIIDENKEYIDFFVSEKESSSFFLFQF